MPSTPYGLNDLRFAGPKIKTTGGTESLQMRVWQNTLRIGIVKEKEFKPIFDRGLSGDKIVILKRTIRQAMKASPGSKFPIVFSAWDKNEKKPIVDYVITILKDEKNCYHIEMQWKGNKYDCLLKGPFGVAYGSDPMPDHEKSSIELESLLDWLDNVLPVQLILSDRKREFDPNGNNASYSANKGGNSGGGSSGGDSFFD